MSFVKGDVVKIVGQNVAMTVINALSKRVLTSENVSEHIKENLRGIAQMFGEAGDPQQMVLCCWYTDQGMLTNNWISSTILEHVDK